MKRAAVADARLKLTAAALIAAIGCGSKATATQPSTGPAAGGADGGTGAADGGTGASGPVTIQVTLDPAHAGSGLVDSTGGTVTTTGADGTKYTLVVPAGALFGAETVTMTPLASATGIPLSGGLIAAVQFEPEGLRFQELAMLTIEPARPVQGLKLHGFGYSGSGTDFQLSPASSSGNGVSVLLMHFSGGGVGSGDDLADLGPKTAEAIALTLLDTLEQNQPIDPHALENVFANWLTGVEFRVNHSTGNDDELILSIDDYSAWSSRIAGYPTVSGLFSDRRKALEAAILVQVGLAVDKASAACKSADDVTRAFFMLRLMGRVEKLGLGGGVVAAVWDKVDGCLRFDLDVESTNVEGIDGPLVSWTFYPVVHATVPIRLDRSAGTELSLKGQAVLKAMAPVRTDFTCHVPFAQNCASTISGSLEGVFSVLNSTFGIDVAMGETELPRHMEMVIGVTELDGIVQFDWDTDGSHETTGALDARIWTDAFGAAHRDEREGAGFRIRKWDVQGGAVFAQKKYENLTAPQSPPLIAVTEPLTTFVLRHTPQ